MLDRLGRLLALGEPPQVIRCGVGNTRAVLGDRGSKPSLRATRHGRFCLGRLLWGFWNGFLPRAPPRGLG